MGTAELTLEYIKGDLAQLDQFDVDLMLIHAPGNPKSSAGSPGCSTSLVITSTAGVARLYLPHPPPLSRTC